MLHFPEPLTPAATALFQYCLEIAADLVRLDPSEDTWVMGYPRSATCLTRDQACEVLRDLLDTLHRPQTYVPTTYHWLVIYECLHFYIEVLNDDPAPDLVEELKASARARDASYLAFPRDAQGSEGFSIDFESFIEAYFWDTDFLLDPSTFSQLGAPARQQFGYPADLFGVLMGLIPHPAELVLKRVDEVEPPEPEPEEGTGALS
jgi:hypothetical protein